jgi:hypothetical protein
MLVNKPIEPLEICYVLHIQKKNSKPRFWRKLSIPGHFTLLKLHQAIASSFELNTPGQFYVPDAKKPIYVTDFDLKSKSFERTIEDVFNQHQMVQYESNSVILKIQLKAKPYMKLDSPFCKSGQGATEERFSKKKVNASLSDIHQPKEFRWK